MGTAGTTSFNLGPRLTLAFSTLIVLILGGNALVVSQFRIIRSQTDRLRGANLQLIAVLRLQANILSFHRRLDDLARSMEVQRLVREAETLRGALHEQTQQTRIALANLPPKTVVDSSFLPTLDTIDVTMPSELDAILELAKSGDWGVIQSRLGNELNPIETQTAILVNSINQQASDELARAVAEMWSAERRTLMIVPATALSTFFIATFFGWSIARHMIELRFEERVNERTRLARDLHDTLLQSFQGVLMKFGAVTFLLPHRPDEAQKALEAATEQAAQAIAEARHVVYGLRSSTIVTNELAQMLRGFGEELATCQSGEDRTDFCVRVEGTSRDLVPIVRDEVYRIACEAVGNAFRHAHAGRIEVEILYEQWHFRLRVRDNGTGVDAKVLSEHGRAGHYGLPGMHERAGLVGGKLSVRSETNSGTEIELSIPGSIAYFSVAQRQSKKRTAIEL